MYATWNKDVCANRHVNPFKGTSCEQGANFFLKVDYLSRLELQENNSLVHNMKED